MSRKPKVLSVGRQDSGQPGVAAALQDACDLEEVRSPLRALSRLAHEQFDGVYVSAEHVGQSLELGRLLQNERILEGMPDGVVLVDESNTIVWANQRLRKWAGGQPLVGKNFFAALGDPEILGPDFCPFHTALATGQPSNSNLRVGDSKYFHLHAAPLSDEALLPAGEPEGDPAAVLGQEANPPSALLVVTVRDVTQEMLQQQKLAAIHRAGIELSDLTPQEVYHMGVEERIELLKANIVHYTRDLLNFDVVEIRLLDEKTGELMPLLSVGIEAEASRRPLLARTQGNGVTGFVAATGKSYLCEDTSEDPLYIEGCKGGKSSLTVPLLLHDQVIGTFNVESPEPHTFTETDLQFLEIFCRDVAASINTLELLVAQRANATQESVEAIHRAVALPVDEILNDAVNVMERYIGHETDVVERLRRILRNARDIKRVIQKVGRNMAPAEAAPPGMQGEQRPKLLERRVLVVDAEDSVRDEAHTLLERYGCIVETAHSGGEAVFMVRNSGAGYDAIIADIRLPDYNGFELLVKLREVVDPVPLALMSGFGYDPSHSIVKARQAGLSSKAVLYKPFRIDQLLETVEAVIDLHPAPAAPTAPAPSAAP